MFSSPRGVAAQAAQVGNDCVDVGARQCVAERRHDPREPSGLPALADGRVQIDVALERGLVAGAEIRKRVWLVESDRRLRHALAVCTVAGGACRALDRSPEPALGPPI